MSTCFIDNGNCIIADTVQHLLLHDADCQSPCRLDENCPILNTYDTNQALADVVNTVMTTGVPHVCLPPAVPFNSNATGGTSLSTLSAPVDYSTLPKLFGDSSVKRAPAKNAAPAKTTAAKTVKAPAKNAHHGQSGQGAGRARANQRGKKGVRNVHVANAPTTHLSHDNVNPQIHGGLDQAVHMRRPAYCDAVVNGWFPVITPNGMTQFLRDPKCTQNPVYGIAVNGNAPKHWTYRCEEHMKTLAPSTDKGEHLCDINGNLINPNIFMNNSGAGNGDSNDDSAGDNEDSYDNEDSDSSVY